ncbi:hypothetical protein [Demequina sp. SO4-18]|uniref:hypothetical protein n=1 Tax=Demequina sp. SO4-18 TaxID=3401026 RepID=UPI003B5A84BF
MRVRALLAGAATAAVLALGTATGANATYPAPEDSLSCEDAVVEPGAVFDCTISGPNGSDATLSVTTEGYDVSIAGTVSLTKTITNNTAVFTITLPADADGALAIAAAIDGVPVDAAAVAVSEDGSSGGDGATDGANAGAGTDDNLAATGFESTGLAIAAGGLLIGGAAVLAIGARRKAGSNNAQSRETVSV